MSLTSASEIAIAQEIQHSFERKSKPTLHTVEYAARSLSARALNGDYYDFLDISAGRIAFVLADISGKGLPAALLMASLRASIIAQGPDAFNNLPGMLKRVHELFYESSPPDHFASLFLSDYNERAGRLRYVNCGHVPPVLFRGDGGVERLGSTAPVVGMLENWNGTVDEAALRPGDVLVMFTDGVTEAKNSAGDEFGCDRLIQTVNNHFFIRPALLAETVTQAVQAFWLSWTGRRYGHGYSGSVTTMELLLWFFTIFPVLNAVACDFMKRCSQALKAMLATLTVNTNRGPQ